MNLDENITTIIPHDKVQILVTDEDKTGQDILAMSDFFGGYIQQLAQSFGTNAEMTIVADIPIADFGIIGEVIQRAEVISQGTTQLLPDFDHLPKDVREKLKDGIYKIGESRQVDGNMRAVIVDKAGNRIKDVTLKEVRINPGSLEASRSLANQLQMRQIFLKLESIQDMQYFQIARDRDRDIKGPVLDARYYILKAQDDNCTDNERKQYLEKAADKLLSARNSLYLDMETSKKHLVIWTRLPIMQPRFIRNNYIGYLTEDFQIVTKVVGLRMQVLDYLGDTRGAQIEMDQYMSVMRDFFIKELPGKEYSTAELIHLNFPYTEENRDCWYQLSQELQPILLTNRSDNKEHIYLISIEEGEDVRE